MQKDGMKYYFVLGATIILHILYFLGFYGIVIINPKYIRLFSSLLQFGVAFILLWRFNPFWSYNQRLTIFDEYIIFSCAFFIVITIFTTELYSFFFNGTVIDGLVRKVVSSNTLK